MRLPKRIVARIHRLFGSELDHVIAPEIKDDLLYAAIVRVASTPGVRQMLEIGLSSGDGSTEAFVAGALANPDRPMLHCIEVSASRHAALVKRHAGQSFVHCYHTSSVELGGFASAADVERFYRGVGYGSWRVSLKEILIWLEQDVRYASPPSVAKGGIRMIKDRMASTTSTRSSSMALSSRGARSSRRYMARGSCCSMTSAPSRTMPTFKLSRAVQRRRVPRARVGRLSPQRLRAV